MAYGAYMHTSTLSISVTQSSCFIALIFSRLFTWACPSFTESLIWSSVPPIFNKFFYHHRSSYSAQSYLFIGILPCLHKSITFTYGAKNYGLIGIINRTNKIVSFWCLICCCIFWFPTFNSLIRLGLLSR